MKKLVFAAFLASLFLGFKKIERPNILWITCEDMSPHLGCYGEKVAKTPHLDQLAKDGIKYSNAFSTAGVCAPSRNAIITGMYQTSAGGHNMRTLQVPATAKYSPLPSYSEIPPEGVKCFSEYLREAGYYCTNNDKQDYQFEAPVTAWDENSKTADWRGRKDKNQPFFSIINLMITHESQVFMRDKEPLTVNPKDIVLPPYYPDNEIVRRDYARFLTNVEIMDKQVGEIIQKLKEDGLYDKTIIFFYSDHGDGLPFVKREIYDRGLRVPLIIRNPFQNKENTIDQQLISFVDFAPTVLSLAKIKIPKYMQGQAFLGTQKSVVARKYFYAARDRMDTEYDRVRAVSDGRFQYLKNYMPEKPYYQNVEFRLQQKSMAEILRLKNEGKLNAKQMYWFRETKPKEELFDLKNDPFEFDNLASNPKFHDKLVALRQKLSEWQTKYGDLGAIPEKELLKKWWNGKETPPKTANPVITVNNKIAKITCNTKGASLGYKKHMNDKSWTVYVGSIKVKSGDSLYVQAQRIGFEASPTITKLVQ